MEKMAKIYSKMLKEEPDIMTPRAKKPYLSPVGHDT